MNSRLIKVIAVLTVGIPTSSLYSQTVVQGGTGVELRYLGDTIWRLRDTTMTTVVFRADTVTRSYFVHGKLTGTARYVVKGDVTVMIDDKDGDGKPRNQSVWGRPGPEILAGGERRMIESAVRSREMNERMSRMSMPSNDAPASPVDKRSYASTANLNIEHQVDTVRYIRGCVAAPPVDTTMYVLFASDSVRRIKPAPRTFDRLMNAAIRADMTGANLSQLVSGRAAVVPGLPGPPKWPCDKR